MIAIHLASTILWDFLRSIFNLNEKDIFTLVLFPDFWPGYTGANPGYAMDKEK